MRKEYSISIGTPCEEIFASGLVTSVEYWRVTVCNAEELAAFQKDAEALKALSDRYGVAIRSFHLPYEPPYTNPPVRPASLDAKEQECTLEKSKQLIQRMLPCKIKYVVVHGGVNVDAEKTRQQLDAFVEYLKKLCDFCKPYGITVCPETLKPMRIGCNSEEMLYIMEGVNRDNLGICFDCNHFINENNIDFLKKAGKYVVTTHLSDYDEKAERHWYPGRGVIDWKRLVDTLEEVGYKGPYVFEVTPPGPDVTADDVKMLISEWERLF